VGTLAKICKHFRPATENEAGASIIRSLGSSSVSSSEPPFVTSMFCAVEIKACGSKMIFILFIA
jgi:hypothetical protein